MTDLDAYVDGVLRADRATLGRAITLVESTRADHQELAAELLTRLLPHAGRAHRVGITGVPGAGKSTLIDALGTELTSMGHRLAVLAVDPSSKRTGGSILGDKTRMAALAIDDNAFIRPSPSAGVLGGVTRATREAIVIVEAAGYDIVLVETVGVGQSETAVANMVDSFLLIMLARAGDSLQGIKKGVLELADVISFNKADGHHVHEANAAARELTSALHMLAASDDGWTTPVLTCSATERIGLREVWEQVVAHRHHLERLGLLTEKRQTQSIEWMWETVDKQIVSRFRNRPDVQAHAVALEAEIRSGSTTASLAANALLQRLT
ncbi:MAG: methylmalonyl Co-A mutase-associated GTPase MeaB [Ilumatobacteraceae bacterium]